jgi:N-acetylglucosaminyldiphosphoundecaprenol N-acetyl-beta-D-mannosaminyltransferase
MPEVEIVGVGIDVMDKHGVEDAIAECIRRGEKGVFAYANINTMNLAQRNERLKTFLNSAAVVYCDGEGVRLGASLLGYRLPPRIVLTYWIEDLCRMCVQEGFSLFLLGGREESAAAAAERIRRKYPALRLAGWHHGYFAKNGPENDEVVARINAASPDILVVAFGIPLQEYWIEENMQRLKARAILPAGSLIEYLAGRKSTAPAWMSNNGMEWVYRLFQEPGRLWKRYILGNPLFVVRVLRQRLGGRSA